MTRRKGERCATKVKGQMRSLQILPDTKRLLLPVYFALHSRDVKSAKKFSYICPLLSTYLP